MLSVVIPSGSNLSNRDWFNGATEEDAVLSLPLDASEGGLFTGNFVPPPPRPLFLDEGIAPDGLTTCDLCSWAWQNGNAFTLDTTLEAPGELGWVLTLVIVSLLSGIIGAIVMIIVLHCRRLKNSNSVDAESSNTTGTTTITTSTTHRQSNRPPISTPEDKTINTSVHSNFANNSNIIINNNNNTNNHNNNSSNNSNNNNSSSGGGGVGGVWSWLSRKSTTTPSQLGNLQSAPVENHYTHMEDAYNMVEEALYAELDRESNSPAYQNSAYTDPDATISSPPSSAYYSDLSVTTVPDRAYEVVGLSTMPIWDNNDRRLPPVRLASISENVSVPSDYV